MKDAFGGIFNLAIVAVFLVVVMGILGLTVNYTKAFRAKNIIISTIEEYGTGDTCFYKGRSCFEKIKERLEGISYHPHSLTCPSSGTDGHNNWSTAPVDAAGQNEVLFCFADERVVGDNYADKYNASKATVGCKIDPHVFTVVTQVDIDIPIVNKIMGLYFFQVKGDTRVVNTRSKMNNCQ